MCRISYTTNIQDGFLKKGVVIFITFLVHEKMVFCMVFQGGVDVIFHKKVASSFIKKPSCMIIFTSLSMLVKTCFTFQHA